MTVLSAGVLLTGCRLLDRDFPSPAGPVATTTRSEFLMVSFMMLFVIGPVLLLVPPIAWHYRLANIKSAYRPQWDFSWSLGNVALIQEPVSLVFNCYEADPLSR